ncbi:MAG: hypothetical protein JWQ96_406 [Segetibacter sp.]|nr:hypothetical protein [Segetibacter sp.]
MQQRNQSTKITLASASCNYVLTIPYKSKTWYKCAGFCFYKILCELRKESAGQECDARKGD